MGSIMGSIMLDLFREQLWRMSSIKSTPELFPEQLWRPSSIELTLDLFQEQFWAVSSIELTPELFPEQLWCASFNSTCSGNNSGVRPVPGTTGPVPAKNELRLYHYWRKLLFFFMSALTLYPALTLTLILFLVRMIINLTLHCPASLFMALVILEMSFYLYVLFREQMTVVVCMSVLPRKLFPEQLWREDPPIILRATGNYCIYVCTASRLLFPEQLWCEDPPGIWEQLVIIVHMLVLPRKLFPEQLAANRSAQLHLRSPPLTNFTCAYMGVAQVVPGTTFCKWVGLRMCIAESRKLFPEQLSAKGSAQLHVRSPLLTNFTRTYSRVAQVVPGTTSHCKRVSLNQVTKTFTSLTNFTRA